jgi:TRAP-type C4-dicarboxylate transport system permease small subunit
MNGYLKKIDAATRYASYIAAAGLASLMFLTVGDVILRGFKTAIVGTYEIVGFLGAIAIGFSFPRTSYERHHVSVDVATVKLSRRGKMAADIATRCICIVFFFILGWNLILLGMDYYHTGEVSPTLQVPFYPVSMGCGVCCFLECFVLIGDIINIVHGTFDSH